MSEIVETMYPGIGVTREGRVFSSVWSRGRQWRELRRWANYRTHYLWVTCRIDGCRAHKAVASLVCSTFHGPKPSSRHQVRHVNGNRHDNRAENLAWGLQQDNADDRARHGRTARGERSGGARLTECDVRIIREEVRNGATYAQLGRRYGVVYTTIREAALGRTWSHVQ